MYSSIVYIEKIKKNAENLLTQCEKLESSFMYDSVPVSHIRNASSWARFTTSSGKKVLIISAETKEEQNKDLLALSVKEHYQYYSLVFFCYIRMRRKLQLRLEK